MDGQRAMTAGGASALSLRPRLEAALRDALLARDPVARSALRRLAEADLEAVVRAEIAERLAAAAGYDQAGRAEADVLRRVLSPGS